MFPKWHIKEILSIEEYKSEKQNFEFNKIAQLDLNKLKEIELKKFGCLINHDFSRPDIVSTEWQGIWDELMKQNVIDDEGYLSSNYDVTKVFDYPQCPLYSNAVMHIIGKKFVVELVRRQWLKIRDRHTTSEDEPDYLKAIHLLAYL